MMSTMNAKRMPHIQNTICAYEQYSKPINYTHAT